MIEYFSVSTTMFTIVGYPMSYIEFFGTVFNLWCVWLAMKNHIWNWPVGLVGVVAFGFLFWQIGLYSDFFEQIYFFITGVWGWWLWLRLRDEEDVKNGERRIITISQHARAGYVLAIITATVLLGMLTTALPRLLPLLFPEPTAFPYLDALTTIMSFAATILMMRRELECWVLWIIVDVIGIGVYWAQDVKLIAILYMIFLVLATKGLMNWYALWKTNNDVETHNIFRT